MKITKYMAPRTLIVEDVDSALLKPNEVRAQSILSAVSHGSEMNVYRGIAPFFRRKQDPEFRLFEDAGEEETWQYPIRSCDPGVWYMGYSNVGRVIEVGQEVTSIQVGDIIYAHAPHQSHIIKPADEVVKLPDQIKPEQAIFFTNLMTTYNGILDSSIKLGDTVVVMGLGVLGQMLAQMAKLSGAFQVIGVDLFERRLKTAKANGADYVFNPQTTADIAKEVRKLTNGKGADLVIEATGNQKSLKEAIRIAAPDTTITALGWYQGACTALDLSEEFHHNRVTIRSSQTGGINPSIRHMYSDERKVRHCLQLLEKLKLENLVTHRYDLEDIQSAYEQIDQDPSEIIQVAITYDRVEGAE
ncbi:zinc-dependent alcohol dehydrogenase [Cohnella sp. 56]|uniref:zinc-dependent alcohol dehydrogenase n=1 Tax=Cohnella sp. 56 TaxID=3113722 RepID=UPI0030E90938